MGQKIFMFPEISFSSNSAVGKNVLTMAALPLCYVTHQCDHGIYVFPLIVTDCVTPCSNDQMLHRLRLGSIHVFIYLFTIHYKYVLSEMKELLF